jgi:hypothetical protein
MYELYRLSPDTPRHWARLYIRASAPVYSIIASNAAGVAATFGLNRRPRVDESMKRRSRPTSNGRPGKDIIKHFGRLISSARAEPQCANWQRIGAELTQRSTLIGNKMGIKFLCPNGHKLHVKAFLSGKKAICPKCGVRVVVPADGQQVDDSPSNADSDDSQAIAESGARPGEDSKAGDATAPTVAPAALADPIDDAPTAVWYVRPATGGQFGPASGEIMRAWITEGRVGASSLVWRAGWQEWRAASAIFPQLSPLLASPGVSVGPPKPVAASMARPLPNQQVGSAPLAAAGLPVGQVVQSVAASVTAGPEEPVAVPAISPGLRKKRRNRDVSLYASAILLVVSVILVVILFFVWPRQEGPTETETPDNEAATDISSPMSSLRRIASYRP